MPNDHHKTISGNITHVFGHRFVVKTEDGYVLADVTAKGLQQILLRLNDIVTLEGEMKPSELGLFVIVGAAQNALLTPQILAAVSHLHLDQVPVLSSVTAVLSNLVSNVPAVLLMKPFVEPLRDHDRAWLVIAMASTLARQFYRAGVGGKSNRRGEGRCCRRKYELLGLFQTLAHR